MACPAGCVRAPGHEGFHTTHPDIAKREDARPKNLFSWFPWNPELRPERLIGPTVEHPR